MEDGTIRRYAIGDEGGSFYSRCRNIARPTNVENLEYKRYFLFEIDHVPIHELEAFDVDFKEIHWTELEKELEKLERNAKLP